MSHITRKKLSLRQEISSYFTTLFNRAAFALIGYGKKLINWYEVRYQKQYWNTRIEQVVPTFPKGLQASAKILLQNQASVFIQGTYHYHGTNGGNSPTSITPMNDALFNIVVKVIRKLPVLQKIIAIQPMQGPVGLIYQMRYKMQENSPDLVAPQITTDPSARRISLNIISQAVEAGTRKLQAGWSLEAMQDTYASHEIDLEDELSTVMADEIFHEIVMEVLADLGRIGFKRQANLQTEDGTYYNKDVAASLYVQINQAMNEIGRRSRRGVGNYMIVSPTTLVFLQLNPSITLKKTEGSHSNRSLALSHDYDIVYAESGRKIAVLTSMFLDTDNQSQERIIVGYKGGNGECDTGYFYSPYIPLMSSGVVINPTTFQPVISLMTRYAKSWFGKDQEGFMGAGSEDYYCELTYSLDPNPAVNTSQEETA